MNLLAAFGLQTAAPGAMSMILGQNHPVRVGCVGPFVLCPKTADLKDRKSSLHNYMDNEVHKAFVENILGNIGRFKPGAAGMDIEVAPFFTRSKGLPAFNDVYCWLYFHVFAGCQKMSWLLPMNDWTLDNIFDRRVLKPDGTPSDDYMLNERLVAHWDFYMYTALYASQTAITAMRSFYDRRVIVYQGLDGKDGRVDWRAVLKGMLNSYLQRFPDCVLSVSKRRKSGGLAAMVAEFDAASSKVDPQVLREAAAELDSF
jgi:hypothetical protein